MPKNYLIPNELTSATPNDFLMLTKPVAPKMIFLEPNEEKFFINFPTSWEKPLNEALGNIYNNGSLRYSFSILTFDGLNIRSHTLSMIGMEFKTYLAGLLKKAKTIAFYAFNGTNVSRFIICKA